MRILVTGGAGFIGSHVVERFMAAGHRVTIVDDLSTGRRTNVPSIATFYKVDVRSDELDRVFDREKPDVVSHHAAQVDVRKSADDPLFDAQVNLIGSINVLGCAVRHGTRKVLYASTGGAVYGEPEYFPVDEAHPVVPLCEYGASKYSVEQYLYLNAQNHGLDFTVLRYPNVYGPRQNPHGEAGVVAVFAGKMLAGQPCVINGDGMQERDFVYVDDCAAANELVLEELGSRGVYNLGWGKPTSVNQVFESLVRLTGYGQPAVYGPAKVGETYRIFLDASHARQELGWTPQVDLDDGLAMTVDFFREQMSQAERA